MLNFVRKRAASVSLLYGKRALQRIEVGKSRRQVELPVEVIDEIYAKVEKSREYHNGDYNPMKWADFAKLKLNAANLIEAAEAGDKVSASSLSDLDWYPKISALYAGQQALAEKSALEKMATRPGIKYIIQGKDL